MKIVLFFAGCLLGVQITTTLFNNAKLAANTRYVILAVTFALAVAGTILFRLYIYDYMIDRGLPFTFNTFFLGFAVTEFIRTLFWIVRGKNEKEK